MRRPRVGKSSHCPHWMLPALPFALDLALQVVVDKASLMGGTAARLHLGSLDHGGGSREQASGGSRTPSSPSFGGSGRRGASRLPVVIASGAEAI
jgi:hypothetical protein